MPAPLRYRAFRVLCGAALIANICLWMQAVGAVGMMLTLGGSPLWVALIQTALTLPAFFFGLPAGVLADLVERRKLLVWMHAWTLLSSVLLLTLVGLGVVRPWNLLALVALTGIGSALSLPVLQASIVDSIPPRELAPAITLNSVGYNAARAIGPAVAGVVIVTTGVEAVFALNVLLLILVLCLFVGCYRPAFTLPRTPEPIGGAVRRGLVYVLQTPALHGYLLRVVVFTVCASALWALLPLVPAVDDGSGGRYGYLLACLGIGAVLGGVSVGRLARWNIALDMQLLGAALAFSLTMLVVAWSTALPWVYGMLVVGGMAWISVTSPLNAAFQRELPGWVRARAIALFLLAFQGAMAAGGGFWGLLADTLGVPQALSLAALCTALGMGWVWRTDLQVAVGQKPNSQ